MTTPVTPAPATNRSPVKFITAELNGRKLAFAEGTEFLVQWGRNAKASFETRARVTKFAQAVGLYKALNIAPGMKKRLLCPAFGKTAVLARETGI